QFGSGDISSEGRDLMADHLLRVTCPIKANLGGTTITIQDFINLQAGDLLVLKEKPGEGNVVYVKDKPMFKGVVGRRDKYRAILITELVEEEESHAV
ncbi:MAG: FliM/FliN family flagellar motor switch protein, partial [Candidatus Neomarinimicrobiota bacterium]